ncbi:MAG: NTPase [Euryarchaeota archaeon]|nr:NTPase [Euryarchaeota archaeon]
MSTRIAITGQPRIGKTTVCRQVIDLLDCNIGGMLCSDIIEDGKRVGFELLDLKTGEKGVLAHISGHGPKIGKYHVNVHDLSEIGVRAIENAMDSDLIIIDEIAPMELRSQRFIRTVERALASDKDMLVVLHQRSHHPLVELIREEFDVITVTKDNRDAIAREILCHFQAPQDVL